MSGEKRPAADSFGSTQLVKRAKSDANLPNTAVAVLNGTAANGALVQVVCLAFPTTIVITNMEHRYRDPVLCRRLSWN